MPIKAQVQGEGGRPFVKEIITTGRFVQDSDGIEFEVSQDTLEHWVTTFRAMRDNGVKVPMPDSHDTFGDAAHNMGFVTDLFVEDESLMAVCELIGPEAEDLARRNDVSIGVPADLVDGKGVRYERPIEHLAFTPTPLIPGLKVFIPIAASRQKRMEEMDWKKLAEALGLEELDEKNAHEQIVVAFAKNKDAFTQSMEKLQEEKKLLEAKLEKPPSVEPLVLELTRQARETQLDQLVSDGHVTPVVRDDLHTIFLGKDGTRLQASIATKSHNVFGEVIDALRKNDPVELGEKTGVQSLRLARGDGNATVLVDNAKVRAGVKG